MRTRIHDWHATRAFLAALRGRPLTSFAEANVARCRLRARSCRDNLPRRALPSLTAGAERVVSRGTARRRAARAARRATVDEKPCSGRIILVASSLLSQSAWSVRALASDTAGPPTVRRPHPGVHENCGSSMTAGPLVSAGWARLLGVLPGLRSNCDAGRARPQTPGPGHGRRCPARLRSPSHAIARGCVARRARKAGRAGNSISGAFRQRTVSRRTRTRCSSSLATRWRMIVDGQSLSRTITMPASPTRVTSRALPSVVYAGAIRAAARSAPGSPRAYVRSSIEPISAA